MQLTVKVGYKDDMRLLRVNVITPWDELRQKIFSKFPDLSPDSFIVKYKDQVSFSY